MPRLHRWVRCTRRRTASFTCTGTTKTRFPCGTPDELSRYPDSIRAVLEQVVREYGLIFAGWSAEYDPALREAIEQNYPRPYTATWIDPADMRGTATEMLTRLQGQRVRATTDDAFGHLLDAEESLHTRQARNPLTLPVTIETTKRELSGLRHRSRCTNGFNPSVSASTTSASSTASTEILKSIERWSIGLREPVPFPRRSSVSSPTGVVPLLTCGGSKKLGGLRVSRSLRDQQRSSRLVGSLASDCSTPQVSVPLLHGATAHFGLLAGLQRRTSTDQNKNPFSTPYLLARHTNTSTIANTGTINT